jgi:Flp pilus assembly protein TadG
MRFLKSELGASLIEFAIVLPILALLAVGIIDVGRWAYYSIVAASSARAGAQYGAQDATHASDSTGMTAAVNAESGQAVTWNTVNATEVCSVSGGALGPCTSGANNAPQNTTYYVKVQVSGTFSPLIAYPGFSSLPVSGSAIIRVIAQ